LRLAALAVLALVVASLAAPASAQAPNSIVLRASFYLAAVDEEGEKGALIPAELTIVVPGNGSIIVSSGGGVDEVTRTSMEMAVKLAALLAGVDWRSADFRVYIDSRAPVGGPSGSAMVALVAYTLLAGSPRVNFTDSIVVTGAISPEGLVASVGGVDLKCEAARSQGMTLYYPLVNVTVALMDSCGWETTYTGVLNLTGEVYGSPPLDVSLNVFPLPREFNATMKAAAERMAGEAAQVLAKALEAGASPELAAAVQRGINASLSLADTHPYAAASLAFTALLNATRIYYLALGDPALLDAEAERVAAALAALEENLTALGPEGSIYYVEFAATAYTRLAAAKSSLEAYWRYSEAGLASRAIAELAHASARISSIREWIASAEASRNLTPRVSAYDTMRLAAAMMDYVHTAASYAESIARYFVENYGRSEDILVYIDVINGLVAQADSYMAQNNTVAAIGFYREALSRSLNMLFQASLGVYAGPEYILDDYMDELKRVYVLLSSRLLARGAAPGLAPAYYDYGLVLEAMGRPDAALLMLEESASSAITWSLLAVALDAAPGQSQAAVEEAPQAAGAPIGLVEAAAVAIAAFVLGYLSSLRAVSRALEG